MLWIEVSKCWKIAECCKVSIKMKNRKIFARPKKRAALRKLLSLPHPTSHQTDATLLRLWNKNYRHLLSRCFKNVVLGRQEMVQCKYVFWHQTETCLLENLKRFLGVLREHVIFNAKEAEVRKMSEVFWAKLYCKMCDIFC